MKNISRITSTLAAIAIAAIANAAPLTPEQALTRALGDAPMRIASDAHAFTLERAVKADGRDALYVFSRPEIAGFIVVSANDAVDALLGYGETNFADENGKTAPAARYWLDQLARRIDFIAAKEGSTRHEAVPRDRFEPIEPLCSTKWGQSWPYNNKCPKLNGALCVTGCAATSMAQVMKFHNWPDTGEGKNSYDWNGQTLRMVFSNTTFDWDNMLDEYPYYATQTQQDAVATLMKAVGYAINMKYSPNGSGATATPMGTAFINNFKYAKSIRFIDRNWVSLNELESEIYETLVNYGPVVYNGQATDGGHSFVCDGYDRDGFFHINWGWNGISDGYFLLDVLDPYEQGTGGASGGFNYYQQLFTRITPNTNEAATPYYQIATDTRLSFTSEEVDSIKMVNTLYNPGSVTIPSGVVGIVLRPINKEGFMIDEPIRIGYRFGPDEEDDDELKPWYGWESMKFDVSNLPEGRYMIRPFFIDPDDNFHEINIPKAYPGEILMARTAKKNTFRNVNANSYSILDCMMGDIFGAELPVQAALTIANSVNATTSCGIGAAVLNEDMTATLLRLEPQNLVLEPDATVEADLAYAVPAENDLENGKEYPVALYTGNGANGFVMLTEPVMMRYQAGSGVRTAGVENIAEARTYYNLQGVKVTEAAQGEAAPTLPAGIYIVRSASAVLKILK